MLTRPKAVLYKRHAMRRPDSISPKAVEHRYSYTAERIKAKKLAILQRQGCDCSSTRPPVGRIHNPGASQAPNGLRPSQRKARPHCSYLPRSARGTRQQHQSLYVPNSPPLWHTPTIQNYVAHSLRLSMQHGTHSLVRSMSVWTKRARARDACERASRPLHHPQQHPFTAHKHTTTVRHKEDAKQQLLSRPQATEHMPKADAGLPKYDNCNAMWVMRNTT